MARKADALIDKETLTILEQLQTKTVGAPSTSTGLVGDQLPSNIISLDDIDLVKNQVFTEVNNLEALNALNTIRQITDLHGYGPIIDSGKIDQATITQSGASGKTKIVTPQKGQVVEILGINANWNTSPGSSVTFGFYVVNDITDDEVLLGTVSSTATSPGLDNNDFLYSPMYITYPFSFRATVSTMGSATSVVMGCYNVRVR